MNYSPDDEVCHAFTQANQVASLFEDIITHD